MAEPIKNPREEAPDAYVARLRDLVEHQHVSSARQRFPEDPALARWQELLAPAKLLGRGPASGADRSAEIQWLDTYGSDYKGEWLAVSGSRLLGHSRSLQELVSRLESDSSQLRPLLHYIPD
jgi:hypothetical protein